MPPVPEVALYGKLFVEAIAALAVIIAVLLFLKSRRGDQDRDALAREADLADRQSERNALTTIIGNHIHGATQSDERLAAALEHLSETIGGCRHNLAQKGRAPTGPQAKH